MRNKIIAQACAWVGKNEADGSHKEIIDVYNGHKPLARGYEVKYSGDAWCATFISSLAIKCGMTDIIPLECSCGKMIELAANMGIFREDDTYIPAIADIILYDWGDSSGKGDNTGWADHIGIVESIKNGVMTVIEGNLNNKVARRTIEVDGRYIRGYICPNYKEDKAVERHFVLNEEMNIRKTPNGVKVGIAPQGAVISGTEMVTHNGVEWLKTNYYGKEGYIAVLPASRGYATEIVPDVTPPKTEDEAERLKNAIKEAIKILSEVIGDET